MEQSIISISTGGGKLNVNYWHGGAGTDMVLLQGGMADAELHWSSIWEYLSNDHRVFAPDLPGFGKSAPLEKMDWRTLSDWLKTFLDTVGVKNTTLVGNSFGGTLARAFAGYHPSYVSHLVFLAGGEYIRIGPLQRLFLVSPIGKSYIDKQKSLGISEEFLTKAMPNFDLLDRKQRDGWLAGSGIIHSVVRDCVLGPVPSDASNLPTLIVWGGKDRHSPLKHAYSLKTEMASSELIVLERAGHLPQLDQPREVIEIINRHISGLRKSAGDKGNDNGFVGNDRRDDHRCP